MLGLKFFSRYPKSRSLSFRTVERDLNNMLKFYQAESVHLKAECDRAHLNRQYTRHSFYEGQNILCKSIILDLISIIDDL
jgi:hypothetical protein